MSAPTGERVTTPAGGFNPTFQRHVAAYAACARLLPPGGRVLDVGAGTGHSAALLAPRPSIAVDVDPAALENQDRPTVVADRDPLRLRRLIPRAVRRRLYDALLVRARRHPDPRAAAITPDDFTLAAGPLDRCLDLVAVCRA